MKVADQKERLHTQYSQSKNSRFIAHTISDAMHKTLRGLDGVARTRLAFSSDRDGERVAKTIQDRSVQEIYVSDYDGGNQQKVTRHQSLDISPAWSPDGLTLAYTSYADGTPDIYIQTIFGKMSMLVRPVKSSSGAPNQYAAWSPDGTKLAFASDRNHDGNYELYIVNRDGSGMTQLINDPHSIQEAPAWSPNGQQLAIVSDKSGSPQIYVISVNGTGLHRISTQETYCDRPTWSPTLNEIAYSARNPSQGYDVHLYNFVTDKVTVLTDSQGTNESPAFSPNGRHIAFTTTRYGKSQIAIVGRDGKLEKRVTTLGNNKFPSWARSMY
jgi:TolB protein